MKQGVDYIGVAVAFFCHDGKGNFLFHKRGPESRDYQDTWDCGGGGVEFGETIEDALWRELQEEYLCSGTISEHLGPATFIAKNDNGAVNKHWIAHLAIIEVDPTEVGLGEPGSMSEIGWFPMDNLPEPMHPGVRQDWDMFFEKIQKYG